MEEIVETNEQPIDREYWRPADHEYEPPVHEPKYHREMPTGPVDTEHHYAVDRQANPSEQAHPTATRGPVNFGNPDNYFYEEPHKPLPVFPKHDKGDSGSKKEHEDEKSGDEEIRHAREMKVGLDAELADEEHRYREDRGGRHHYNRDYEGEYVRDAPHYESRHMTQEEQEAMSEQLSEELARRHLGHKVVKQPIWTQTSISDVQDSRMHTLGVTQVVENVYDDLSADRTMYSTSIDTIVDSTIGFLPDDDGILKTFIDRYTTMLIHDSVYMEELPAPHFMH